MEGLTSQQLRELPEAERGEFEIDRQSGRFVRKSEAALTAQRNAEARRREEARTASNGFGTGTPVLNFSGTSSNDPRFLLANQSFQESRKEIDPAEIRKQARRRFQAEIDAVDEIFNTERARIQQQNKSTEARSRAILSNAGIRNSARGSSAEEQVIDDGERAVGANEARRRLAIQEVFGRIDQAAQDEITQKEIARRQGTEQFLSFLSGQQERDAQRANEGINNLATIIARNGGSITEVQDEQVQRLAQLGGLTTGETYGQLQALVSELIEDESLRAEDLSREKFAIAQTARQLGLPTEEVARINNAPSLADARAIFSSLEIPDKTPDEAERLKIELLRAELDNQNIQNSKALSELEGSAETKIGISPVTGKAFTENQSKSGLFAKRALESSSFFEENDRPFNFAGGFLPERLKSSDRKQFEQAETNFITAILRKESGAAIANSEFKDARKVYIPQAGDDEDTLAQKAIARETAIQGLVNESAGAFGQLEGELEESQSESANKFTSASGNTFEIPN